MNRRELIHVACKAAVGFVAAVPLLAHIIPAEVHASTIINGSHGTREQINTVLAMLEQTAEVWMRVPNRKNPPLIYFGEGPGYVVKGTKTPRLGNWEILVRDLTDQEWREWRSYVAPHIPNGCGSRIGDPAFRGSIYRVRGWIRDGRHLGWNMSISGFETKGE